jgi:hypothetical protein
MIKRDYKYPTIYSQEIIIHFFKITPIFFEINDLSLISTQILLENFLGVLTFYISLRFRIIKPRTIVIVEYLKVST